MKNFAFLLIFVWVNAIALHAQTAYEVWFTAGSVRHHGLIRSGDNGWQMRVKYFDAGCRCERLIEQQMQAEETNLGTRLSGHSVRDVLNNRQTRDYAADRFYLYRDPQGNVWSRNLDEQGIASGVALKPLPPDRRGEKLKAFGW